MGRDVPRGLAHHIRDLTGLWRTEPRSDGELLAGFAAGDGAAFAALVVRHGRAVWATCRRILGNDTDAEDAFQATFIAFARKAGEVRPEAVSGWLRKVANEVSLNLRKAVRRKVAAECRLAERAAEVGAAPSDEELRAQVAEEVALLPERLRVPLTLYFWEGKTQAEVGRILGVTDRAAAHRVKQALKLIRERLARRGVAVSAAVVVAALENVACAVPARLAAHVAEAALAIAAGAPSESAAAKLALEATRGGGWGRLKLCALVVVPALCAIVGGSLVAQRPGAPVPTVPPARSASLAEVAPPRDRYGDPLPAGAVARLGTLRFRLGAPGGMSSVAFASNGTVLVSNHGGGTIHFWDAASGRELRALGGPTECWAVAVAPDGARMAAVGTGEVWCWDLTAGGPALRWKVPAEIAGAGTVEFSPDGKVIACGGDSGRKIRVLDAEKGAVRRVLPGRGCRFTFSANSEALASWPWSGSGDVSVWDLRTGALRFVLAAGGPPVGSVAFSPDAARVATVGGDRHLRVWDAVGGGEQVRLAADADPHAQVG
ncbi:MAG TPA: sigma-70 family RNA polymerase sigma factor, partial [Gemmata sp.]